LKGFDRAFELLLEHEGGYSDNPHDAGGKTRYGVTEKVARTFGYQGDMRSMPIEKAKDIYREQYWKSGYDQLPFIIAFNVFDGAVNSGSGRSIRWLQEAVAVETDGVFGKATLAAAMSANPFDVVRKYNALRLDYLASLEDWKHFGRGWARRLAKNLGTQDQSERES
jgi:lysozyme family protein